jgi:hypothetical protein
MLISGFELLLFPGFRIKGLQGRGSGVIPF